MGSTDGAAASHVARKLLKAAAERLLAAAGEAAQSWYDVWEHPRRVELLAAIAVAYAAIGGLTQFARRLDARGQRAPLNAGERWMKLGARLLASLVIPVLRLAKPDVPATVLLLYIWIW